MEKPKHTFGKILKKKSALCKSTLCKSTSKLYGKTRTYFLGTQYYFSHLLSLFSFTSGIPVTQISFVVVPHIPEDLFIYFTLCFIPVVKIGSFLLSSSLLILPFVPTILFWIHLLSFFIQLLYFSVLKFLFGSLYLLFLCWDFLFLFLRLSVFPLLLCTVAHWSLFIMAALIYLSDNSCSFPSGLHWHSKDGGVLEYGGSLSYESLESLLDLPWHSCWMCLITARWVWELGFPFSLCWHEWGWGLGFLHSG